MLFRIIGIIGLILVIMGLLAKTENKRFGYFSLGGIGLFVYSLSISDFIFVILQAAFTWFSYSHYRKSKHRRSSWR